MRNVIACPLLCAALLTMAPLLAEKDNPTPSDKDHIDVIAHIPPSGGSIVQLTSGTHGRRNYLYLSHGTGKAVTILDVTDPTVPKAVDTLDLPTWQADGTVTAIVGNAMLVTSPASAGPPDGHHPKLRGPGTS